MLQNKYITQGIIAVLGFLALFLFGQTIGTFKGLKTIGREPATNTISVTGEGEEVAVPELATFSFGVMEESLVVSTAQKEATNTANSILAFLKKNSVADRDIKTTGYNIYPRYEYVKRSVSPDYYSSGKQELAAYVVSQNFTVKVRKLEDAGKIISGLGELGANDVSGLSFGFDDAKEKELVREARQKAIDDAQEKAEALADDLGVKLVRIVNFSEGGSYPAFYTKAYDAMGRGGEQSASAPLPTGENKIMSNITIVYEIR